jgi:hypothetical protein
MDPLHETTREWIVMAECPQCHVEHEDLDGFGVLYCLDCGYCTHASIDGNRCNLCGEEA